jgi:predicted ATPase
MSGAVTDRAALHDALEFARSGDTLIVWKLDRLARSMKQLIETIEILRVRGIGFRSLTEALDTTTIEEGLGLLDEAVKIVERTGERWLKAELYRLNGQLLLRQGHTEAAQELYRKALSIAVEQQAKMWELRAAASLARLWRDQGRRTEARDLLAPIYGWFTEGFNTSDLKEAKALLGELA